MYTVTRSGARAALIAAELTELATQRVPKIVAQSLTFTAQRAQKDIIGQMSAVFAGGATRFTLGGTRIVPATADNLAARVAVKDMAASGGTKPESALAAQVFGGQRTEKRFERALRLGGLLRAGESVVPGQSATLDSYGNLGRSMLKQVLQQLSGQVRQAKTSSKKSRLANRKNDLFVGAPSGGKLPAGVWRREGGSSASARKEGRRRLQPLLIFVSKPPSYSKKLDFGAIAKATAVREFEPTFLRLLRKATAG